MKTFFTFLLVATSFTLSAQFTEKFESSVVSLTSNCWTAEQIIATTNKQEVITGNGSAYTNPPTSGTGERTLSTPFLDMTSSTVNISFKYKISSKIAGQSTRTIRVGLIDKNGVFTQLDLITLNSSSATTVFTYNKTFTMATPGVYRLGLRLGGATGDGNSRLILDDLYVSASAHYGPTNHCNTGAVAVNDTYSIPVPSPYSGNLFTNDQIPADGDVYTSVLVADSTHGILVINSNGTFTFTPYANFLGGTLTFTYQINDNGYTPLVSNTATATLNFGYVSVLPMHLKSFTARSTNEQAELSWTIIDNETGSYFEVQASVDGKNFERIAMINATEKIGTEQYVYRDDLKNQDKYYRIVLVNRNHTRAISAVKFVRGQSSANALQLIGNPVASQLVFRLHSVQHANATVSVYNMSGIRLLNTNLVVAPGMHNFQLNAAGLRPGNYILEYATGTEKSITRFVKK